jgi:hypothetical protein
MRASRSRPTSLGVAAALPGGMIASTRLTIIVLLARCP